MKTATLAMTLMAAMAVSAADVKWVGAAGVRADGTYSWHDPDNWDTGTLPGEADNAFIQDVSGAPDPMLISLDGETVTVAQLRYSKAPKAIVQNGKVRLTKGQLRGDMNGYGVTVDIEQVADGEWYNDDNWSKRIVIFGDISGDGVITSSGNVNRNIDITGSKISVPQIIHRSNGLNLKSGTRLYGTEIVVNGGFADGNYNGTSVNLQLNEDPDLSAEDAVAFNDDASLSFMGSGGAFNYTRPVASPVDQRLSLALNGGKASLKISGGTADGNYLTVTNFSRVAGTYLSVDGTAALRLPALTNEDSGYIGSWIWGPSLLPLSVDEDGTLTQVSDKSFEVGFPTGGGNASALMRTGSDAEYTLSQDSSVFWLWDNYSETRTFHLGQHVLNVHGALMFRQGGKVKTIDAEGEGRIVFHGDQIVVNAAGGGTVDIKATVDWNPQSSSRPYPDLILVGGSKNGGDGVVLSGRDNIGDYGVINGALLARKLVFDGESDRRIHGTIHDALQIEQRGCGTLTFEPTSGLLTRKFGMSATDGKIVMKSSKIGVTVSVSGKGVYELAEGVTMTQTPKIQNGGTYQGFGVTTNGVRDGRFLAGGVIAPGNETKAGTLTMGGMKPEGDFTLVCRIDEETNGKIAFGQNGKLTLLTDAMTGTIRVDDLTSCARKVRLTDEFVVVDFSKGSVENATKHGVTWQVTTGTPKCLDVSAATVTLDTSAKCLKVSGIKTMNKGLSVIMR